MKGLPRLSSMAAHGFLWVAVVFSVFPFVWMVLTSARASGEAFDLTSTFWVGDWRAAENYARALTETPILRFLANGVIVCGTILFFQIATALPCAYALAKLRFRGKGFLTVLIVVSLTVPFQAVALPLFVGLAELRLLDSYFALVIPFVVSFFAILLLSQFLRGYPDEVIEAARLDGFSEASILWRLILPASLPAVAAFSIFSVSYHWNDLYWPLIVVSSLDLAPPTLGILFFRDAEGGDSLGPLMAAAAMITAPLLLLFLFAQRRFVQGVSMSGLK